MTLGLYVLVFFVSYVIMRHSCFLPGVAARIEPGAYPRRSLVATVARVKVELYDSLVQKGISHERVRNFAQQIAGVYFEPVMNENGKPSALPPYGANEQATCHKLLPDVQIVGPNTFWAEGANCHALELLGGQLLVHRTRFSQNNFLGNSAVIEPGDHPANYLVGVNTVGNSARFRRSMHSRMDCSVTIFGNPAFPLSSNRTSKFNRRLSASSVASTGPADAIENKPVEDAATKGKAGKRGKTLTRRRSLVEISGAAKQALKKMVKSMDQGELDGAALEGERAFAPGFREFMWRAFLYDCCGRFFKSFPKALKLVVRLFWMFNEFLPLYERTIRNQSQSETGANNQSFLGLAKFFEFGEFFGDVLLVGVSLFLYMAAVQVFCLGFFVVFRWTMLGFRPNPSGPQGLFAYMNVTNMWMWSRFDAWGGALKTFEGTSLANWWGCDRVFYFLAPSCSRRRRPREKHSLRAFPSA